MNSTTMAQFEESAESESSAQEFVFDENEPHLAPNSKCGQEIVKSSFESVQSDHSDSKELPSEENLQTIDKSEVSQETVGNSTDNSDKSAYETQENSSGPVRRFIENKNCKI